MVIENILNLQRGYLCGLILYRVFPNRCQTLPTLVKENCFHKWDEFYVCYVKTKIKSLSNCESIEIRFSNRFRKKDTETVYRKKTKYISSSNTP